MTHTTCKEEIAEAHMALRRWDQISQSLDIESKDFTKAAMVYGTIQGWIHTAESGQLLRRTLKDAIDRQVEVRGAAHLLSQTGYPSSQLDMSGVAA